MNITSRNISYYRNLGYICCIGDITNIDITHLNKNSHYKITAICELCSTESEIPYHKYIENKNRHNYYGCKKCSRQKASMTSIELYGEANYMSTEVGKTIVEKTMYIKYGHKTNLLNKDHIERNKKIMMDRYNVEYAMQSDEILYKSKKTLLNRYGVDSFSKTDLFKDKQSRDSWVKYLTSKLNLYKITDYKLNIPNQVVNIFCSICNDYYEIDSRNLYQRKIVQNNQICTRCNPLVKSYSVAEKEIFTYISDNYTGCILSNDRTLIKMELDIYLPVLNIGFEYNGLYWHSDIYKDKDYHLNKTNACLAHGVRLIHIYEDDWLYKKDIVKSRILHILGKTNSRIYARECVLEYVDASSAKIFLDTNHLNGYTICEVSLGLFYLNDLVAIMCFKQDNTWELSRFCTKLNTTVIGGMSKLFKSFTTKYKYQSIITYLDRSWVNNTFYEKLGFKPESITKPKCFYIKDGKRYDFINNSENLIYDSGCIMYLYINS